MLVCVSVPETVNMPCTISSDTKYGGGAHFPLLGLLLFLAFKLTQPAAG